MTGLAGLCLAAAETHSASVVLTDGNAASAANLERVVAANKDLTFVSASRLEWSDDVPEQFRSAFDVVICSDCLFFDEYREALGKCIKALLSPGGKAIVVAPARAGTFRDFVDKCEKLGFQPEVKESGYCEKIDGRRKELLEDQRFDEDTQWPMLLNLKIKDLSN